MHRWAKEILECVKTKAEGIGIDNFEGQMLDDLKDWTEIAKNIAKFDKDYKIVEAMEKSEENEEIMEMLERYEDYPDRRFYDHYRYKNGRFAPKGKGTYRRGYEEPPYYFQTPDMYHDWDSMGDTERRRDLDRMGGRMYYTEPMSGYDKAKRHYTESREMHKGNTPAEKEQKMKDLEAYLKELSGDVVGIIDEATPEERTLLKAKMTTLLQKM